MTFYQGSYQITQQNVIGEYQVAVAPVSVAEYTVNGNEIDLIDLTTHGTVGYSYTYQSRGE
jgi:hypothetical protein